MGGRWHSGIQQRVGLDEEQDVVRQVLRGGEQGSCTHTCTGPGPGGHMGGATLGQRPDGPSPLHPT